MNHIEQIKITLRRRAKIFDRDRVQFQLSYSMLQHHSANDSDNKQFRIFETTFCRFRNYTSALRAEVRAMAVETKGLPVGD